MLNCKNSPKLIARLNTRIINQLNRRGINIRIVEFIPGEVSTELSVDGVRGLMSTITSSSVGILSHYNKKNNESQSREAAQK